VKYIKYIRQVRRCRGGIAEWLAFSGLNAEGGPGFESRCGQRSLVMELVNIYPVLSCSFVEIMPLCVVSVSIN